jgi:hypothetical protein
VAGEARLSLSVRRGLHRLRMNILDRRFKYTPAANTDLRKTFKRIRAEQKAKAERERANEAEAAAKVQNLQRRTK